MLAKVQSCAVVGLDAEPVHVEVDIATGLERVTLVGLPDAAVRESSERVRAAVTNSGYFFPQHRLTINLAPADLRKEGPAYDLPIAVGILVATRQAPGELDDALILGELSLDGSVRHVNGVLPMASMAQQRGYRRLFVPTVDAPEAALVEGINVYPIDSLAALVQHLNGTRMIARYENSLRFDEQADVHYPVDFADIKGQEHAKRALESLALEGTIVCYAAHREPERPYWRAPCHRSCPSSPCRNRSTSRASTRWPMPCPMISRWCVCAHSARRTTPSAMLGLWVVGDDRALARSAWRTAACSFWTNCPNLTPKTWRRCASRWKTAS